MNTWIRVQRARLKGRLAEYISLRDGTVQHSLQPAQIEHKLTRALPAAELALTRIEDGTYRQCIACKDEIPQARLNTTPSAARCVECQEDLEKEN